MKIDKAWVVRTALFLATLTVYLEAVVWLMLVGGTITGVFLTLHTAHSESAPTTHPFLGVGVGAIIGSIVLGLFYVVVFRAVRLYAVDKAFEYREKPSPHDEDRASFASSSPN